VEPQKLNCRGEMDSEFPLNAVCLCNKVFVTGLILSDMIIGPVYVYTQHHTGPVYVCTQHHIPESHVLLVK
jgi:hypothetical protein